MTLANDVPLTVAYVAKGLGLRSIELKTAKISSDKLLMKNILSKKNINVPKYSEVKNIEDILQFKSKIKSDKIIIKPTDSRGARGVLIIDNEMNLDLAINHSLNNSENKKIIVEEYIEGPQISSEGYVLNGIYHNAGFSDRNYEFLEKFKPFIIENGGTMPSKISNKLKKEICKQLQCASEAINLKNGPLKGDIVIDNNNKVYIIEIATRLSGGYFCTDMIPNSNGIDLVNITMKDCLGEKVFIDDIKPKYTKYVSIRYWFPKKGILKSVPSKADISNENGIIKFGIHYKVGSIFDKVTKHPDRLGYVMTKNDLSYIEAENQSIKIINKYKKSFEIE